MHSRIYFNNIALLLIPIKLNFTLLFHYNFRRLLMNKLLMKQLSIARLSRLSFYYLLTMPIDLIALLIYNLDIVLFIVR